MLIIRLARRGRKNQAFFDLVVAEKSQAVQKKFVAKLGYLDPLLNKGEGKFVFDAAKIKKYISNGAQLSQAVARLLVRNGVKEAGKFIETRPTKPKKEVEKKKETSTQEELSSKEEAEQEIREGNGSDEGNEDNADEKPEKASEVKPKEEVKQEEKEKEK